MRSVFIRFSPRVKKKLVNIFLLLFFLLAAWQVGRQLARISDYEKSEQSFIAKALEVVELLTDFDKVIFNTLPILASVDYTQASAGLQPQEVDLGQNPLAAVAEPELSNPKSLLESQLSLLRLISSSDLDPSEKIYKDRGEEIIPDLEDDAFDEDFTPPSPEFIASDKPLVAIYNTHNAETYELSDGQTKLEGKNAGVAKVAAKLGETLESKGISVIRSTTIHDYPSFARSYTNSAETVKAMLAENPSIQIVIDVHRDAGVNRKEVVKINNKDAAKIMLVVGTNTRLEHPHWKKNKAFADTVAKKMDELYPGLSKGVRMQDGRYNQHVHPNAILIEIGNAEKTTYEEAEYAAILFADVIHHVLADMQKTKL